MLFTDIVVIVIIMADTIIPNLCLAENEFLQDKGSNSPLMSKLVSNRWTDEKNSLLTHRRADKGKNIGKSYLNPIAIKLNNVIAKYEMKKSHLEDIYMGVVGCGVGRCEKFKNLIPENQKLRRLHCFKKNNGFKKMISDLLLSFHSGIQRVDKSFQVLINFERWPHLSNRSRRKILEEFKIDIKTLNIEIETVMTNKRLNFEREPRIPVLSRIQKPENQTHLMIYEWRIIQSSRRFLRDWQKNLRKMTKCWRRRRQRNREKVIERNFFPEPEEVSANRLNNLTPDTR